MTKPIDTRTHGVLDYSVSALLAAAPWLLGFRRGRAETWVPVVLGAGAIAYSLLTDYELGAVRELPMPAHLALDLASGVTLAASPWLFGFAGRVKLPHVIFGLAEIGVAVLTQRTPSYESPAAA